MLVEVQVMYRPLPRRPARGHRSLRGSSFRAADTPLEATRARACEGSSAKYVVAFPGQTRPSRVIP